MTKEILNQLSKEILDGAIMVHREMGPGLLEAVYQQCMMKELALRSRNVQQMVMTPLVYKGFLLSKEYVIDIFVEGAIILELKAVDGLLPVHEAQIISYLKLTGHKLGFLINFNVPLLKHGFKRFVNNF